MFEIKGSYERLKDLETSMFSLVLKNILSDESTKYILGEKQLMITCGKKYETSFVYLEDKGTFFGVGDDAYVVDSEGKEHYFKSIRIKSTTYSETDVFVVISYQWTLEIEEEMLNEFLNTVQEIEFEQPIDSDFYKKFRKYFYIFGGSFVTRNEYGNIEGYKNLVINNDGILVYRKVPLIQAIPAVCNC